MTQSKTNWTIAPFAFAIVLSIYLLVFYIAWVGCIGGDDSLYIQNARMRTSDPFMVGRYFWELRLTLILPMALAFKLLGESEFSAVLATLLYTFFTGSLIFVFLLKRISIGATLLITALVATSPLLAVNATSLRIDAVETFFVVASLLACLSAIESNRSGSMLVLAGVCAGLAIMTRPTAIALAAFYGVLFIVGYRIPRHRYLLIGIGFALVWVTETLIYFGNTGIPFYRLMLDFNHDQVVRAGSLFESIVLSPIKMLLGSHSLGLVFWCLPLAAWHLTRGEGMPAETRHRAIFFSLFSITWIVVFSGFASKLVLDPRYLTPAVASALVVIGLWIDMLMRRKRIAAALTLAVAFFVTHTIAIYFENKDFAYSQRWLTVLATKYEEPIYTDPQTFERARFLLELQGVKHKVIPEPAPPGGLFVAVPKNNVRGTYNAVRWNPGEYNAGDWQIVEQLDPGRRVVGSLLESVGISNRIPSSVWEKLNYPNPPIFMYRRP